MNATEVVSFVILFIGLDHLDLWATQFVASSFILTQHAFDYKAPSARDKLNTPSPITLRFLCSDTHSN